MTAGEDAERRARVELSFLADPGDVVLAALRARPATEVLGVARRSRARSRDDRP